MVARGAGAIGCAHCKKIGAEHACQICTRLVCATCAANWATCGEPSGRVVRLGLTARVRDVDPNGRIALVSHWRRPLRLFDLRRLRWIDTVLPRHYWVLSRQFPPRLSAAHRLYHSDIDVTRSETMARGIRVLDLHSGSSLQIADEVPFGTTGVSSMGDRYYYVTTTQEVLVTTNAQHVGLLAQPVELYEPLPRKVLHAAFVDGERDLLAAGSWNEVVLHRMVGGQLERLGYAKTEKLGDVCWIAVAGPWLVAIVAGPGASGHVEVRRLERDLSIGPVVYRHGGTSLRAASLSRDGRYLAFGGTAGLVVHELDADRVTIFEEHSDRINFVRFAADDHVLISADTDNRIVMRPRTPNGYARPVVAVEVPEQPIALAPLDPLRE